MKLNLDSSLYQPTVTGPSAPVRPGGSARSGDLAAGGDSVSMSGVSSTLHRSSAERSARIDALTHAVASGAYKISSADIGKAVIRYAGG